MAKYKHDYCDSCHYLGTHFSDYDSKTYDLYVCNRSYVARYGDPGGDYRSWMKDLVHHLPHNHPIREAKRRDNLRKKSEI